MPHIKEEEISAYLDNQLSTDENCALEAHLTECENCRAVCDEMRDVACLFQEAERFEPSPFLWNRIAADLVRKQPSAFGWRASIIAGLRNFSWSGGAVAAVFAILLFAGIAVFHSTSGRITDQAALAEIDQVHKSLAAKDPDRYNPFSSNSPYKSDINPFRNFRLSSKMKSAPETTLQH